MGWFSGWNTSGACAGILLATFVGYELNLIWMIITQWLLLLALSGFYDRFTCLSQSELNNSSHLILRSSWNIPTVVFTLLSPVVIGVGLNQEPSVSQNGAVSFFGRDGVILIDKDNNLIWDGLWHSRLSQNNDHVGSYNWALAVDPILAHPTGKIHQALVVGIGTGVTAATLAKHEGVGSVDAYDINQTLKRVLARYPAGTLQVAENSKIHIIWQDGRSGLALNDKQYDLITQQPLHLKQAGASILLSLEYFRLVEERLKPDGVFLVYANGSPEQALAVRQTAAQVFPHLVALHNGYELVLSKIPLDFSVQHIETLLRQEGKLWEEIRGFREAVGNDVWLRYISPAKLPVGDSRITVRDDFPIIEYPTHLNELVKRTGLSMSLPHPGFDWRSQ